MQPPTIASDPLAAGMSPIEQLLRILGLAANVDDPQDNADSIDAQAERDAQAIAAAEAFTTQDEQASAEVNSVAAQDQTAQLAQQLPQMISGIAGAVTGALGGALAPLVQIPQQLAQAAFQTGMGAYRGDGASDLQIDDPGALDALSFDDIATDTPALSDAGLGGDGDGFGDFGGGGFGGADPGGGSAPITGTIPTGLLGPPPVPSASTAPASAPAVTTSLPNTAPAPTPAGAGMAGVPMVPPGAMTGANGADKDAKADTKRITVPQVRNGTPVQGRLTAPPVAPVIKRVEGKPVASRRIIAPGDAEDQGAVIP
ncbi:MAG: hypothetical protein NT146_06675 [Mycobacterium sp.]|nr:hypothetical protein [Mycobacterium sp.]